MTLEVMLPPDFSSQGCPQVGAGGEIPPTKVTCAPTFFLDPKNQKGSYNENQCTRSSSVPRLDSIMGIFTK